MTNVPRRPPRDPEDDAAAIEEIIDEGEEVFSHEWDSGGSGAGAGTEVVFRYKNRFAISSQDCGDAGPFRTLKAALKAQDLLCVTGATTAVDCSLLSAKKLAALLTCDDEGYQITINGEPWTYHAGRGFQPDADET